MNDQTSITPGTKLNAGENTSEDTKENTGSDDDFAAPDATPARPHRLGRLGAAFGIAAAIALAWFLFTPEPIKMETSTLTQGPMQVSIDNQGQVRAVDKFIIATPVAAELMRMSWREGDAIKKQQLIAVLRPLPLDRRQQQETQARLDAAKALVQEARLRNQRAQVDLQLARNERARLTQLAENGFVSPQVREAAISTEKSRLFEAQAAAAREQALQAEVRAIEASLATSADPPQPPHQLQLTSPVAGSILKVYEKSQRALAAGAPLVAIGDLARYEIVIDVLSPDAVKIKPGSTVWLEGWGGPAVLEARVRLVETAAFTKISALGIEEQRVNVIADPLTALPGLGDGYRVEARIVIWSAEKVNKLAGSSVFRAGGEWHVFALENGRARERAVQIGQRNQDEVQVVSGLAPGAVVIRYPGGMVREGARVVSAQP